MLPAKVTFYLCLTLLITQCKSDCSVSIKNLKNILVLDQNNNIEYSNDGSGTIVKKQCEFITLACPGTTLRGSTVENQRFICRYNTFRPTIAGVTCDEKLKSIERKAGKCNREYDHLQIGFQYKNGDFIPQIDLCWDNGNKRSLWTKVKLQKQVAECPLNSPPQSWMNGTYFDKALANKYLKTEQLRTLNNIFHNNIPTKLKDKYLERGHLVAKCDFVYDAQQKLTFHYINAAPQWDSFNKGNWKTLEGQIRTYANNQTSDLDVYTGTYDVLQIDGHQYYLDFDSNYKMYNPNNKIPVPKYFWKIVIKGNLGVAIVGSNDIFTKTSPVCPDVLNQIKWLSLRSATDEKKGYMIACNVPDFMNIPSLKNQLPNFPQVSGLLT